MPIAVYPDGKAIGFGMLPTSSSTVNSVYSIYVMKSSPYFIASDTTSGYVIQFGIGSGHYNRGNWDATANRWQIYSDENSYTYVQGGSSSLTYWKITDSLIGGNRTMFISSSASKTSSTDGVAGVELTTNGRIYCTSSDVSSIFFFPSNATAYYAQTYCSTSYFALAWAGGTGAWTNSFRVYSSYSRNGTHFYVGSSKSGSADGNTGVGIFSDGRIELSHASSPYIDFHYANSTSDYTARIINSGTGQL
ncbi:MAG: hypothetical protein LUF02_09065 [Erysipelotrichaceae bacterium]|nr:hypothetical protein [Erysipelotrichaceae bacterium]